MKSVTQVAMPALRLLLAIRGVSAGSGWFEPRGMAESALTLDGQLIDSWDGVNTTISDDDLFANSRRWVMIDKDHPRVDLPAGLWPDQTIPYCFESAETQKILGPLIKDAMTLWYRSGLPESFRMEQVSNDMCKKKNSQRGDVLEVRRAVGDLYASAIGKDAKTPVYISLDETQKNMVSKTAHEIGHVWGLHHEHQNPAYWSKDFKGGEGGKVFTKANFKCEKLVDRQETLKRIKEAIAAEAGGEGERKWGRHREEICTDHQVATLWGFSAAQFLPVHSMTLKSPPGQDIDWDSIMLYGSDKPADVITKPDGTPISDNWVPTTRDVEGLMILYGVIPKTDLDLLQQSKKRSLKFAQVAAEIHGMPEC